MLDLFCIFSKGGIVNVLWCFQGNNDAIRVSVNALICNSLLEERSGNYTYNHQSLTLQYRLDNELDLVFLVGYQKSLNLTYVDNFLSNIHKEFKARYNDDTSPGPVPEDQFRISFDRILKDSENWAKTRAVIPKRMRMFTESDKSKKTVASLIERKGDEKNEKTLKNQKKKKSTQNAKVKQPRVWIGGPATGNILDYTADQPNNQEQPDHLTPDTNVVGQMRGNIREMEESATISKPSKKDSMFKILNSFIGQKVLSDVNIRPVMDKLQDHLIAKNVAAEIAKQLCESVVAKLQGKSLTTFESVSRTIKRSLAEAIEIVLTPKKRVDVLQDSTHAKVKGSPYVIVFCGVNGVGKSTSLAKISFWLIENDLSVMIAACDTFRAGAVEQLRTHTSHLNALHPESLHDGKKMVQLFEKGYGKDAANIGTQAIQYAKECGINVVLIDTAGRMQDNAPLMRGLAKVVSTANPDLVLFVGEALVGQSAVDQVVKFDQALAEFNTSAHTIDGIVLTKFDTVDDKVGAAISLAYTTGKPIMFVGTGQTYADLKSLNPKALAQALMK